MKYYFQRITPFNYFLAYCISIRYPVYAWKIIVPGILARRFILLRPYESFTHDQWMRVHDECYQNWKEIILPAMSRKQYAVNYGKFGKVDNTINLNQRIGDEFQQFWLFLATVQHREGPESSSYKVIAPPIYNSLKRVVNKLTLPEAPIQLVTLNSVLEMIYNWLISSAYFARSFTGIVRALCSTRLNYSSVKLLWAGISPQEIPNSPHKLDFSWAAGNNILPKEEILYILPSEPLPPNKHYLKTNGIQYVTARDLFRCIPKTQLLLSFYSLFREFSRTLARPSHLEQSIMAALISDQVHWLQVFQALQPACYMTSMSASWPEKAETALAKHIGVKIIIWAYSANFMLFARNDPKLLDHGVARSILMADECWLWSKANADWISERLLGCKDNRPIIRILGPLMCGNPDVLYEKPQTVRKRLGIKKEGYYISVFDIPPVTMAWRNKFGGRPPYISEEYIKIFYDDMLALLKRHSQLNLILKLKRSINDPYRSHPDSLMELLSPERRWKKEGRIIELDVNIDPFLPIAAGDAAIGMTFTSPVYTAASCGRPAAYYDPLHIVKYYRDQALFNLRVTSTDDLQTSAGRWIKSAPSKYEGDDSFMPVKINTQLTDLFQEALQ